MTFAWPRLLWLLALPAALLAWELLRRRRFAGAEHPKILRAEAGLRTVNLSPENAAPTPLSRRRVLLCAGIALGIVALARPQWGRLDEQVFDQSREIIIALDLSRSMTTPDVKPSRLDRSKLLIQSLLDRLRGERVGLIVFSGTAFLQSPVSSDYEILREFLPALGPDYLPEGGTNYRQLIEAAAEAFGSGSAADRYLIILSDGEATDDDWKGDVPELVKKGVRVIGLGVGTAHGAMIPDGAGGFMKDDNGAVVLSKLESGTLRDLAIATHGTYRDASEWVDLPALLSSTVDAGRKGRFIEQNTVRYVERYQWALAQALACLIASFLLEFPVQPKPREVRLNAVPAPRPRAAHAAAAALAAFLLATGLVRGADEAAPTDPATSLSKVVGRLSSQDRCSAVDWAEMASETLTWGQHLGTGGKPVPEPPVRDALAAVDEGSRLDQKAADWPHLKSELEKLLQKPDQKNQQQQDQKQKQDQKKDQQQDQKQQGHGQDQKNQDQKNQDQQKGQDQKQGKDGQQKQQDKEQSQSANQGDSKDRKQDQQAGRPKDQKAFGDMGKPDTKPPEEKQHQGAMQKVGGVTKDQQNDPAMKDPELAVSLEKLEQVKNEDSPAELFDLMRKGEPSPPEPSTGKKW
ncbi:MAG TPA: VWA domain-containing protein [Opitutaceae bacterium]